LPYYQIKEKDDHILAIPASAIGLYHCWTCVPGIKFPVSEIFWNLEIFVCLCRWVNFRNWSKEGYYYPKFL